MKIITHLLLERSKYKMAKNILIEDARMLFRNFAGKAGMYNSEGERSFCIVVPYEQAEVLEKEGWNIRWPKEREDSDLEPFLSVKVRFDNYPPTIVMVSSRGKTKLDADSVGLLDWADIESVDVIVTPYNYKMHGREGTTAYLKSLYAKIAEDILELKYSDAPDKASDFIGGCGGCETCEGNGCQGPAR